MPDQITEAANRCLVVGFTGHTAPDELRRLVAEGLGGVILAARNVRDSDQLRALTDSLRAEREDVLVSIDSEGGGIGHLERTGVPLTPGSLALGVVDDVKVTGAVAGALASHLAALGITVSYSPVADVQLERTNPIVRLRSFGSDPELAARHTEAWIRAHQAAGVASCAKHFPGHGSTTVDSHIGLPVDARSIEELFATDLIPFQAAISAGTELIMTAHVVYPALDNVPATLSRRILTDLLRTELNFQGVVVTDALEMKAIADQVGEAAGAAAAINAGADIVLVAKPDLDLWLSCRDSAATGADPEALLVAAERVRSLSARCATPAAPPASDRDAGLNAARQALRTRPIPAKLVDPYVVDLYKAPHPALGWAGTDLVTHLQSDGIAVTDGELDIAAVLSEAADRQLVIATDDPVLRPWQAEARGALLSARPDAVLISTGMPEDDEFCTFGRGEANLQAAAELLG